MKLAITMHVDVIVVVIVSVCALPLQLTLENVTGMVFISSGERRSFVVS